MDDKRLSRIEVKLDDVADHIGEINVTLGAQRISLDNHIHRTELLEEALKPIRQHVYMMKGGLALLGILSTLAGIAMLFHK